jgi:tetratricopeptide (TPR) repeat protein
MKENASTKREKPVLDGRNPMTSRNEEIKPKSPIKPKEKKKPTLVIVLIILIAAGLGFGAWRLLRPNSLTDRIVELGPGGAPPETIEGLRRAIDSYEARLEERVRISAQAGIYWKILAVRYMDRKMFGEALEALESAVSYFPEDATLHYLTGVSAGVLAKSFLDFSGTGSTRERDRLYALAESGYKRAIDLDPRYARPLYGLGVLYVFELTRPTEAIPYLERFLALRSKDTDAMFVLARAYYASDRPEDALALYDRILKSSVDAGKKAEAEKNKKTVLEELYGAP